ncbi:MAG: hypothetical protein LC733_06250, partial [Actinobacteria bacterium]|nr:hypothetical protein [Actinomycetota bacterium]
SDGWRPPARRWQRFDGRGDSSRVRTGGPTTTLYLDIYPPGLQPGTASHVPRRQLMRPVSDDGHLDSSSPRPLPPGASDHPLVYVTVGTVFNDAALLQRILAPLHDLDARILVTVGPQADPAVVGAQPPHVRVERYVPQHLVLPHCDVVVSHAGSGTVLATLTLGIPQLCLPQGADQFLNGAAVATAGAGISLMPGEGSADAIRGAIVRLLGDAAFRVAAHRVSESIASMPSPDDVAVTLETLA